MAQLAHQKNAVDKYLIQAHFSFWFLLQNERSSYAKTNTSAAYIKCEKSGREKMTQYVGEMGGKRTTHKTAAVHNGRRIMHGTHTSRRKSGVMDGTLNKM